MKEEISRKAMWDMAARNGLILGLATAACRVATQCISLMGASTAGSVLALLIWAVQFGGCIWLMRFFMLRLTERFSGVDNKKSFQYGMLLALTSAFIFSAFMLVDVLVIFPDTIRQQMDVYYQLYGKMLDNNSMTMLQKIEDNYAQIMFFSTLLYSFLYGTVLSSILSMNIPKRDPFADYKKEDNQETL